MTRMIKYLALAFGLILTGAAGQTCPTAVCGDSCYGRPVYTLNPPLVVDPEPPIAP